jgi:serine/threonine-protein kinase
MSPDGKWITYTSFESGVPQVYVRPFPGPGGKYQVSTTGGSRSRWRRDGKELYYIGAENKIMAAEVSTKGESFVIGVVRSLFEIRPLAGTVDFYDVTADGNRFLVNKLVNENGSVPVTLVVNWDEEYKKK